MVYLRNAAMSICFSQKNAFTYKSIKPFHSNFRSLFGLHRYMNRKFSSIDESVRIEKEKETEKEQPLLTEINKHNFEERLEKEIKEVISRADFIAIDLEMSGIESANFRRPSEIDTTQTRYLNYRHSAESFSVVQLGMCSFEWDDVNKQFLARPYNFHVFPHSTIGSFRDLPSRTFLSQINSLQFLSNHNFDFNTWVKDGISYLSEKQEKEVFRGLGLDQTNPTPPFNLHEPRLKNNTGSLLNNTSNIIFADKVKKRITAFREFCLLKSDPSSTATSAALTSIGVEDQEVPDLENETIGFEGNAFDNDVAQSHPLDITFVNDKDNSFLSSCPFMTWKRIDSKCIEIIKQVAYTNFNDVIVLPDSESNYSSLKIYFCKDENNKAQFLKELELEGKHVCEMMLSNAIGVRKIIDLIQSARIPIVGHNFILDLAHIHSKFFHTLPVNVHSFSSKIRGKFPCIFDTKYMVRSSSTLRDLIKSDGSSLSQLYLASLRLIAAEKMPPVKTATGFHKYANGMHHHEAGFDAYMTGVVFSTACNILSSEPDQIKLLTAASALVASRLSLYSPPYYSPSLHSPSPHSSSLSLSEPTPTPQGLSKPTIQVASMANLVCMGRKGAKEMVFDFLTGREAIGDRDLPAPKASHSRLPDRRNVVLLWNVPTDMTATNLRTLIQSMFKKKEAMINFFFLDSSATLVEFYDARSAEEFLETIAKVIHKPDSSVSDAAKDMVKSLGIGVGRFVAYEQICQSLLPFKTVSEAAALLVSKPDESVWFDYKNGKEFDSEKDDVANDELAAISGKFIALSRANSRPIRKQNLDENSNQNHKYSPFIPSFSSSSPLPSPSSSSSSSNPDGEFNNYTEDVTNLQTGSDDNSDLTHLLRQRSNVRMQRNMLSFKEGNENQIITGEKENDMNGLTKEQMAMMNSDMDNLIHANNQPSVSGKAASFLDWNNHSSSSSSPSNASPSPSPSHPFSFAGSFFPSSNRNSASENRGLKKSSKFKNQLRKDGEDSEPIFVMGTFQEPSKPSRKGFQISEDLLTRPRVNLQSVIQSSTLDLNLIRSSSKLPSRPKDNLVVHFNGDKNVKSKIIDFEKVLPRSPTVVFRKDVGNNSNSSASSSSMNRVYDKKEDAAKWNGSENGEGGKYKPDHGRKEESRLFMEDASFTRWLEEAKERR